MVSGSAEGGVDAGQPWATIDFSSFHKDNFSELYGKGFRVTCATCSAEYINIMFCYDKEQADFPESFEIMDTSQTPPVPRTIHNLPVELKNMKDGSDIVRSIVQQLKPELDHYTDVAVGEPSSTLLLLDKRAGDIIKGDTIYQARVLSGVYTNCTYDSENIWKNYPDENISGIEVTLHSVKIYVGSEPGPQYINIDLPYLTLENLGLNPPAPDLSSPEAAAETLGRANKANNVIAAVRGAIGANYNRLEHAKANLLQTEENAADAYSTIRDADMAQMMMELTKISILQESNRYSLMHTFEHTRQIIGLLNA